MNTKSLLIAQVVTILNVLIAAVFSIVAVIDPNSVLPVGSIVSESSQLFAMYYAARSIPIAIVALVVIFQKNIPAIIIVGTLAGIIQLADAGVGMYRHDLFKMIAPVLLGILQLVASYWLSKSLDS